MGWQWKLNSRECIGCGICADVCPNRAILMTRDMAYPAPVVGKCEGCPDCSAQCPTGAISVVPASR